MNLEINYIEERCKPEGTASGLLLKAYDIYAEETKIGNVVKTNNVLGIATKTLKDAVTKVEIQTTIDKVFKLDTLYRCIIDTGVEIPDTTHVSLELQPLSALAFTKGIWIVPSVYVIQKGNKRYIGVVMFNMATYPFSFKQFDQVARLKITEKSKIVICHKEDEIQQ